MSSCKCNDGPRLGSSFMGSGYRMYEGGRTGLRCKGRLQLRETVLFIVLPMAENRWLSMAEKRQLSARDLGTGKKLRES